MLRVTWALLTAASVSGMLAWAAGAQPLVDVRREVEALCRSVPDDDPGEVIRQRERERLLALGEPARRALLDLARRRESSCAVEWLVELQDERVLATCRRIVKDSKADMPLRGAGAWCLAMFRDPNCSGEVARLFRGAAGKDGAPRIRAALISINDEVSRAAVREALADPAFADQVFFLIQGLGVMRDAEAVGLLVDVGQRASERKGMEDGVRFYVAQALARIGSPESRRASLQLINACEDEGTRLRAAGAVIRALYEQRRATDSPEESAELDALLAQLEPYLKKIRGE